MMGEHGGSLGEHGGSLGEHELTPKSTTWGTTDCHSKVAWINTMSTISSWYMIFPYKRDWFVADPVWLILTLVVPEKNSQSAKLVWQMHMLMNKLKVTVNISLWIYTHIYISTCLYNYIYIHMICIYINIEREREQKKMSIARISWLHPRYHQAPIRPPLAAARRPTDFHHAHGLVAVILGQRDGKL